MGGRITQATGRDPQRQYLAARSRLPSSLAERPGGASASSHPGLQDGASRHDVDGVTAASAPTMSWPVAGTLMIRRPSGPGRARPLVTRCSRCAGRGDPVANGPRTTPAQRRTPSDLATGPLLQWPASRAFGSSTAAGQPRRHVWGDRPRLPCRRSSYREAAGGHQSGDPTAGIMVNSGVPGLRHARTRSGIGFGSELNSRACRPKLRHGPWFRWSDAGWRASFTRRANMRSPGNGRGHDARKPSGVRFLRTAPIRPWRPAGGIAPARWGGRGRICRRTNPSCDHLVPAPGRVFSVVVQFTA